MRRRVAPGGGLGVLQASTAAIALVQRGPGWHVEVWLARRNRGQATFLLQVRSGQPAGMLGPATAPDAGASSPSTPPAASWRQAERERWDRGSRTAAARSAGQVARRLRRIARAIRVSVQAPRSMPALARLRFDAFSTAVRTNMRLAQQRRQPCSPQAVPMAYCSSCTALWRRLPSPVGCGTGLAGWRASLASPRDAAPYPSRFAVPPARHPAGDGRPGAAALRPARGAGDGHAAFWAEEGGHRRAASYGRARPPRGSRTAGVPLT